MSRGSGSLVLNGGFKNLVVKGPANSTVSRAVYVPYCQFLAYFSLFVFLAFFLEECVIFMLFVFYANFSLDLEKKILNFDLVIPKLRIDATYNLKGNILLLPIVGSGNVVMSMKDVKSSVYTKISIRKKPEVCVCFPIFPIFPIFHNFSQFIQLSHPIGSDPHRRHESDILGGCDANPFGKFVQRQQSARRIVEYVFESKCQRSDIRIASGFGTWFG